MLETEIRAVTWRHIRSNERWCYVPWSAKCPWWTVPYRVLTRQVSDWL